MESVVGALLSLWLLSAVVTATALAVGDQEYDAENLDQNGELAELEQRFFGLSKKATTTTTSKGLCGRVCQRWSEVPVQCAVWRTEKKCDYWEVRCTSARPWLRSFDPEVEAVERDVSDSDDTPATISEEERIAFAKLETESVIAFRKFHDEKVMKAERYELTKSKTDQGDAPEEKAAVVIVTLAGGRRFALARGKELWKADTTAILKAEYVTDEWQLAESKDVQFSTVADYVRVSDSSSSSTEAADKMMLLE